MSDRINVAVATLCTSGLAKDGKGSRATDTPKSWFLLFVTKNHLCVRGYAQIYVLIFICCAFAYLQGNGNKEGW